MTVIVASYNNHTASKFYIHLLTLSQKDSNPEALNIEIVDISRSKLLAFVYFSSVTSMS